MSNARLPRYSPGLLSPPTAFFAKALFLPTLSIDNGGPPSLPHDVQPARASATPERVAARARSSIARRSSEVSAHSGSHSVSKTRLLRLEEKTK